MRRVLSFLFPLALMAASFYAGMHVSGRSSHMDWRDPAKRAEFRQRIVDRMSTELSLSEDQRLRISEIMERRGKEFGELRKELKPKFEQLRHEIRDEISVLLSPEQLEKFKILNTKMEEERKKKWE